MVVAGRTNLLISPHAGILSEEECVNVLLFKMSSLLVMDIRTVKEPCAVNSTMEVVGRKPEVVECTLLVLMTIPKVASVHLDSRVMESTPVNEDVDECEEKLACRCPECKCKNTWGSYECSCNGNLVHMQESDTCIAIYSSSMTTGGFIWMMLFILAAVSVGGYAFYKYRVQSYMDSEIRAIMAQYMPLDNEAAVPNNQVHHDI